MLPIRTLPRATPARPPNRATTKPTQNISYHYILNITLIIRYLINAVMQNCSITLIIKNGIRAVVIPILLIGTTN